MKRGCVVTKRMCQENSRGSELEDDRQPEQIYLDQFEETGKEDMLEAQKSIYGEINYQDRPPGYNEVFTQFLMDAVKLR